MNPPRAKTRLARAASRLGAASTEFYRPLGPSRHVSMRTRAPDPAPGSARGHRRRMTAYGKASWKRRRHGHFDEDRVCRASTPSAENDRGSSRRQLPARRCCTRHAGLPHHFGSDSRTWTIDDGSTSRATPASAEYASSDDAATQQIVCGPSGHTGWHSHPGPVIVTVKSGSLRLIYANDCTGVGTVYSAGDTSSIAATRSDIARNESSTVNVEIWATYLVPGAPGTPEDRRGRPGPAWHWRRQGQGQGPGRRDDGVKVDRRLLRAALAGRCAPAPAVADGDRPARVA